MTSSSGGRSSRPVGEAFSEPAWLVADCSSGCCTCAQPGPDDGIVETGSCCCWCSVDDDVLALAASEADCATTAQHQSDVGLAGTEGVYALTSFCFLFDILEQHLRDRPARLD